jgi:hypothetical protein
MTIRHLLQFLILSLPFGILPAAVVATRLAVPFDANAMDSSDDLGYSRLPLDFNGDGTLEFVLVVTGSFVDIVHVSTSRVFIAISPPPNLGGSAASILGGVEINGFSGNDRYRWYTGQPLRGSYPEIPDRVTSIAIQLTTGSEGHTRGKDGYLGLEFELADGIHFGWMHFDASANLRNEQGSFIGVGGLIDGWAWETTPGQGIIAGAVPEPSAVLLTALSVAGLFLWRQRSKGLSSTASRPENSIHTS